jgi:hypothetical protein
MTIASNDEADVMQKAWAWMSHNLCASRYASFLSYSQYTQLCTGSSFSAAQFWARLERWSGQSGDEFRDEKD